MRDHPKTAWSDLPVYHIPFFPNPGFYETTMVEVEGRLVDHNLIDSILYQPPWNFRVAVAKVDKAIRERWNSADPDQFDGWARADVKKKAHYFQCGRALCSASLRTPGTLLKPTEETGLCSRCLAKTEEPLIKEDGHA